MIKLALIGKGISHSKSPMIYRQFLGDSLEYKLLDYETPNDIPKANELLTNYLGISITAPYKNHFLAQIKMSEQVRELKAVNCLYLNKEDGEIWGTNTDLLAMREILSRELQGTSSDVVILGSGAMARVTALVLRELGFSYRQFSRSTTPNLSDIDLREATDRKSFIINCCAREYEFRGKANRDSLYWDLNYSREQERKSIESLGLYYVDGEELLLLQAKHALGLWGLKIS